MAELEEKLNSILGNREAMEQIMALARSFSSGNQEKGEESPEQERQENVEQTSPSPRSESGSELSDLLGQIDPEMLQVGMRLIQEYQGKEDRSAALLSALRPFLREERRAKLDQALRLTRMTHLARVLLDTMGGRGSERDV
ncbi:MAG: hypothetical protein ACOX7N_05820 [Lawsonibacter sp.]|jgi:hypothetical protein